MTTPNTPIIIEKGIPLPLGRLTGVTHVLRTMEVGDSFFIQRKSPSVGILAYHARKQTAFVFTCRSVTENEVTGTRVWRTK